VVGAWGSVAGSLIRPPSGCPSVFGIAFELVKDYKSTLRREKRSIELSGADQGAGE